jgi:hypothetical protein
MSASATSKKQCVTCNKSGGILTCDGCQQTFCGKHVTEHRQELGGQLDNVMQDHDLLQQELGQPSPKENPLLQKIDKWEQDSIAKIQATAETARKTLRELLEQSKERVSKECRDIKETLRSARDADDFSENDLDKWKKQLKELQLEMTSQSSTKLIYDKSARIYLIKLENNNASNNQSASNEDTPSKTTSSNLDSQEQFCQTLGSVKIEDGNYLLRHNGAWGNVYTRGRFLYSTGCHTIRFTLEKCSHPYRIFFGCMSSQTALKENAFSLPDSVGWFGSNQVHEHGSCSSNTQKYGYNSTKLQTGDELHLIIDCNKKQIRLFHQRLKTTCTLSVNPNLAPFPWHSLVVLGNPGDSVRILPNV